jgi:hypothetical protein
VTTQCLSDHQSVGPYCLSRVGIGCLPVTDESYRYQFPLSFLARTAPRRYGQVLYGHPFCPTKLDFAEELCCILEEDYPTVEKVVLGTDKLGTHGIHAVYEVFEPEQAGRLARRLEWHFTPEHASWLQHR